MTKGIALRCYHCSSEIFPGDAVEAGLGGITRTFCCPGCMAIAQTIHGEGLEVFYSRRSQSSDKPAAYLMNCCQFRSTTKESLSIVNHCSNMG